MTSAKEIVERYKAAMGRGDFTAARELLHDDLAFYGPIDTFNRADDYIAASKRLANIIQRIDLKKVFVDGDDVCVLYDMVTNTPAGTAFIYHPDQRSRRARTGCGDLCPAQARPWLGRGPGGAARSDPRSARRRLGDPARDPAGWPGRTWS
jgi:hypothetical protein